ncbi:hypothetical protein [Halovivax limisalsi]|uniref:hypothetical protein n=1 Tax=Halovivax limisalsi TaxID=1453760 RepID=UPI001FFCE413|nr:hypothetical protein [Halovivax limisalsi]
MVRDHKDGLSRRSLLRKSTLLAAAGSIGTTASAIGSANSYCEDHGFGWIHRKCDDWPPEWAHLKFTIDLDPYNAPEQSASFQNGINSGGDDGFYDTNSLGQIELVSGYGRMWDLTYEEGDTRPSTEIWYFGDVVSDIILMHTDSGMWKNIDPRNDINYEWL